MSQTRFLPDENEIPARWHNVVADRPSATEPVRKLYRIGHHSPFFRARPLKKDLSTSVRIVHKNEELSPTRSHKPNHAVAQAYYSKANGIKHHTIESDSGQHGSAISRCAQIFGLAQRGEIAPTPESSHAIRACIDKALKRKESGEARTLFSNFSGNLDGYPLPQEAIDRTLANLPKF